MKVYITFCKDGYNGFCVDKVFKTKKDAIDYILMTKINNNSYYDNWSKESLNVCAEKYIEEHEIV